METNKKKLIISKEVISSLSDSGLNNVKGGMDQRMVCDDLRWSAGNCTGGCTDGCGGSALFCTCWNCTQVGNCTVDCETGTYCQ